MRYGFLFISLMFIGIACNNEERHTETVSRSHNRIAQIPEEAQNHLPFKFTDLQLYQNLSDLSLQNFKKYGNFYTSNLAIYQIRDLKALEENNFIQEIYLYFIDSTLLKIQAITKYNMVNQLLRKNGKAKMTLKDSMNRRTARQEGVVKRINGRQSINKHLTRYRLTWNNDKVKMTYRVDEYYGNARPLYGISNDAYTIDVPISAHYVLTMESKEYRKSLQRVKMESIQDLNQ